MICIILMFYMLVNSGVTSSDLQHDVTNYIHLQIIIVSIITCKFIDFKPLASNVYLTHKLTRKTKHLYAVIWKLELEQWLPEGVMVMLPFIV